MKVSVIIPTYNEAAIIEKTLRRLQNHAPYEVIVVDGGSEDDTVARARSLGVQVLESGRGRARQLNCGAKQASGEVFLFLHADTWLPDQAFKKMTRAFEEGCSAGRFRMRFDEDHWLLKIFSSYTRFHAFSYGDQAFFVRKELFRQLNGFDEEVPFEDIDFYRRLRKRTQPMILSDAVTTSARRFTASGCLRQKCINILLVALYHSGLNVFPLKKALYPDIR